MKIAIESNDGETIKSPFVKTKGYLVYDVEDCSIKDYEYRKSSGLRSSKSNKTVKRKEKSVLGDCKTVITRGMDLSDLKNLKNNGIDVFITFKTSAKDAVRIYLKEHLLNEASFH